MVTVLIVGIVTWFVSGVAAIGFAFSDSVEWISMSEYQIREAMYKSFCDVSFVFILIGPIGLGVVLGYRDREQKLGWLWPWSKSAKRKAGVA